MPSLLQWSIVIRIHCEYEFESISNSLHAADKCMYMYTYTSNTMNCLFCYVAQWAEGAGVNVDINLLSSWWQIGSKRMIQT